MAPKKERNERKRISVEEKERQSKRTEGKRASGRYPFSPSLVLALLFAFVGKTNLQFQAHSLRKPYNILLLKSPEENKGSEVANTQITRKTISKSFMGNGTKDGTDINNF
ncbi:hypothetical protein NPIL_167281 [Nephila pilipes]|uniref:Uncharacterized protein n=1 Tax=Nephila pilipes TaxID=299642 RepID=A0A8X6MRH0_NEPPI|nr:hypothetical protein NPIL_167281 [Nephila pilipes]